MSEAGIVNGFAMAQQVFLNFKKKNPTNFLNALRNVELLGSVLILDICVMASSCFRTTVIYHEETSYTWFPGRKTCCSLRF